MTDEEYQRYKEEEKAHLRAKKRLQDTARRLRKSRSIQDAVRTMSDAASDLLDESASLINQVRTEAARKAARLSVVLDDAIARETLDPESIRPEDVSAADTSSASAPEEDVAEAEVDEALAEAQRRARADELVRQMKMDTAPRRTASGKTPPDEADDRSEDRLSETPTGDETNRSSPESAETDEDLPERTIGRMRSAPDS